VAVQLAIFLANVAKALWAGRSIDEASTYSQRAYELVSGENVVPMARDHGTLLAQLGRCTEAMEVRQPVQIYTGSGGGSYLPQKSDVTSDHPLLSVPWGMIQDQRVYAPPFHS
jgi:hypothetical protein